MRSAPPGKLIQTVLDKRIAGPLVIVDEVEIVGEVHSSKGSRHSFTDVLLPLPERMTVQAWDCPLFQGRFGMSWVNQVMTANSRAGLPEPLQSRCVVLDLPELTVAELRTYARHQGAKRGLTAPALDVVEKLPTEWLCHANRGQWTPPGRDAVSRNPSQPDEPRHNSGGPILQEFKQNAEGRGITMIIWLLSTLAENSVGRPIRTTNTMTVNSR